MNILVIGAGNIGTRFAKAALWCGQMNTYSLKVTICDESPNLQAIFESTTPELDKEIKRFSPHTVLEYEAGVDVVSSEFERMLTRHLDAAYIFIALGNDALSAETAKRVRSLFEREKLFKKEKTINDESSTRPFIAAVIRDNAICKALKSSNDVKSNKSEIMYYGCNEDVFQYDCFFSNPIFRIASAADKAYEKSRGNMSADIDLTRTKEIENSSNRAFAVHSRYKLHELGIELEYEKAKSAGIDAEVDKKILLNLDKLIRLEHVRWSVFYLIDGYKPLPRDEGGRAPDYSYIPAMFALQKRKAEKDNMTSDASLSFETKNHMAMVHTCLEDFENLDAIGELLHDDVKKYDSILCVNTATKATHARRFSRTLTEF